MSGISGMSGVASRRCIVSEIQLDGCMPSWIATVPVGADRRCSSSIHIGRGITKGVAGQPEGINALIPPRKLLKIAELRAANQTRALLARRRGAWAKQIGDLLGGQAGARHPALASSRSTRPFV
jgi:hypothetical protein